MYKLQQTQIQLWHIHTPKSTPPPEVTLFSEQIDTLKTVIKHTATHSHSLQKFIPLFSASKCLFGISFEHRWLNKRRVSHVDFIFERFSHVFLLLNFVGKKFISQKHWIVKSISLSHHTKKYQICLFKNLYHFFVSSQKSKKNIRSPEIRCDRSPKKSEEPNSKNLRDPKNSVRFLCFVLKLVKR